LKTAVRNGILYIFVSLLIFETMKKVFIAASAVLVIFTSCTDSSTVKVPAGQHVYSDVLLNNANNEASDQFAEEIAKNKEGAKVEAVVAEPAPAATSTDTAKAVAPMAEPEAHGTAHEGHSSH